MIKLQENIDYRVIVPVETGTLANIEILNDQFKDVIFRYGKISANEEEDGTATLSFEYDIIDAAGMKNLEENEDFKNFLGDLISSILLDQIEKSEQFTSKQILDDVDESDIIEE
jgi:hypothetical protein